MRQIDDQDIFAEFTRALTGSGHGEVRAMRSVAARDELILLVRAAEEHIPGFESIPLDEYPAALFRLLRLKLEGKL